MLMAHKPPKPPSPEKEKKKLEDRELKKAPKRKSMVRKRDMSRPDIAVPRFQYATDVGGLVGGMGIVSPDRIREIKDIEKVTGKVGFELGEVDSPPQIVRKFNPVYPFGAKRQGITGRVLIRCLIGTDGKADKFKVLRSEPDSVFDEAAINAVTKWRFKPGILNGDAVPTWVRIPITFELD
jgi:protein TonB